MADLFEMFPGAKIAPFPGGTWNRHNDATRWVERHAPATPAISASSLESDCLCVRAINRTGAALQRGNVVELVSLKDWSAIKSGRESAGWPTADASSYANQEVFGDDAYLKAVAPTAAKPAHWGVVLVGSEDGARVDVVVQGLASVRVNVTDAGHERFEPTQGDAANGTSGGSGAPLVYKAQQADAGSETGVQWCLTMLGVGSETRTGVANLNGDLSGASGSITGFRSLTGDTPDPLPTSGDNPNGLTGSDGDGVLLSEVNNTWTIVFVFDSSGGSNVDRKVALTGSSTPNELLALFDHTVAGTPPEDLTKVHIAYDAVGEQIAFWYDENIEHFGFARPYADFVGDPTELVTSYVSFGGTENPGATPATVANPSGLTATQDDVVAVVKIGEVWTAVDNWPADHLVRLDADAVPQTLLSALSLTTVTTAPADHYPIVAVRNPADADTMTLYARDTNDGGSGGTDAFTVKISTDDTDAEFLADCYDGTTETGTWVPPGVTYAPLETIVFQAGNGGNEGFNLFVEEPGRVRVGSSDPALGYLISKPATAQVVTSEPTGSTLVSWWDDTSDSGDLNLYAKDWVRWESTSAPNYLSTVLSMQTTVTAASDNHQPLEVVRNPSDADTVELHASDQMVALDNTDTSANYLLSKITNTVTLSPSQDYFACEFVRSGDTVQLYARDTSSASASDRLVALDAADLNPSTLLSKIDNTVVGTATEGYVDAELTRSADAITIKVPGGTGLQPALCKVTISATSDPSAAWSSGLIVPLSGSPAVAKTELPEITAYWPGTSPITGTTTFPVFVWYQIQDGLAVIVAQNGCCPE